MSDNVNWREFLFNILKGSENRPDETAGSTAGETKRISMQRTVIDQIEVTQGIETNKVVFKTIFELLSNIDMRLRKLENLFVFEEEDDSLSSSSREESKANIISLLQESDMTLYRYEIADHLNLDLELVSEIVNELKNDGLID
ncbi:hypothetical protein CEE45_10150 [Candidatus Heimdallarchaeota archaeon B3_Heim]|nr:MAG: hypothetical protein CEE45_10150 [Candidatus Heimdallarchaeota archaeon B3_Heim]